MIPDKIILYSSSEAAEFQTVSVVGWVNSHGKFYGKDEHMARWSGCTHVECKDCGESTDKAYLICDQCRSKKERAVYDKKPRKEWDETGMLYSEAANKYFYAPDDLEAHYEEYNLTPDKLRLVICEPVYAKEIDPNDYYCDDLPDDGEITGDLADAFEELNEKIRSYKEPLSWVPGKYAAVIDTTVKEKRRS